MPNYYEAIRAEIICRLREERLRRKLSNYAIAQNSGVSESMLSLVERGLRNPTMELLLRIADGIGVDLADITKQAQATVLKKNFKQKSKASPI
ncbi:MAG TPA: helix-turn-helix transcriptional regulator [Verrucomicrobiae bacterium]|nr:helix-turn-helix transcriptional regulator [Verrucomicrobiae bacterium]